MHLVLIPHCMTEIYISQRVQKWKIYCLSARHCTLSGWSIAPTIRRNSTLLKWPFFAAKCSAVDPLCKTSNELVINIFPSLNVLLVHSNTPQTQDTFSCWFTFALNSQSSWTTSVCPFSAAAIKGTRPRCIKNMSRYHFA